MEEQREAFEHWGREVKLWRGFERSDLLTEQYQSEVIQAAWDAWQAATAAAKKSAGKSWVI